MDSSLVSVGHRQQLIEMPTRHFPFEIARIIAQALDHGDRPLLFQEKRALKGLRLLDTTFATAAGEVLFKQFTCRFNNEIPWQTVNPTVKISQGPLGRSVQKAIIKLEFHGDEGFAYENQQGLPHNLDGFRWLSCFNVFERESKLTIKALSRLHNVKEAVVMIEDAQSPLQRIFLSSFVALLSDLGPTWGQLESLKVCAYPHNHQAVWGLYPSFGFVRGLSIYWQYTAARLHRQEQNLEDEAAGVDILDLPSMSQLKKISLHGMVYERPRKTQAPRRLKRSIWNLDEIHAECLEELNLMDLALRQGALSSLISDHADRLRHIRLNNLYVPSDEWRDILEAMSAAPGLVEVAISRISWINAGLGTLELGLQALSKLSLRSVYLSGRILQAIIRSTSGTLEEVDFNDVQLNMVGWAEIFDTLQLCNKLTDLTLYSLKDLRFSSSEADMGRLWKRGKILMNYTRGKAIGDKRTTLQKRALLQTIVNTHDSTSWIALGALLRQIMTRRAQMGTWTAVRAPRFVLVKHEEIFTSLHPIETADISPISLHDGFVWDIMTEEQVNTTVEAESSKSRGGVERSHPCSKT